MDKLSTKAKLLIARLTPYTLLGIIENLAYSIANHSEFFSPFVLNYATWFTEELNTLDQHQKLQLIKEITAKIKL